MPLFFICAALAIHDVDGPIRCHNGIEIRLAGIGATEMDGTCRPNQPCIPGDPREQRRVMAQVMGAEIEREDAEDNGSVWFKQPVGLACEQVGKSYRRVVAYCAAPYGRDLSCEAIRAGIAARWAKFDRRGWLTRCVRR